MNPILFLALAAILIGGAFFLAALPILQQARRQTAPAPLTSEQEELDDLLANREAAFQALRELSFDHRVGKITDDDFVAFESHLKHHAAETLRALDEWEARDDLGRSIERAVERTIERTVEERRRALTRDAAAPPNAYAGLRLCPSCQRPASAADRFCGGCGSALPALSAAPATAAAGVACPHCGQPCGPEDRFCAGCGLDLVAVGAPGGMS